MQAGRRASAHLLGVASVAVAVIGAGIPASIGASSDRLPRDPGLTLHVRLTVANDLPSSARSTLIQEAEGIWRREGVRVQWLPGVDHEPRSGLMLRVLVGRLLGSVGEGEAWPVGRLLPDQSGERIAIASITGAQRVLASAGSEMEPSGIGEHRLGLVLGRAVAHEIGHYLLGTRSHARAGLMRAQIGARDFADLRDGGFFLDEVASRWIRNVLSPGATSGVVVTRFDY